MSTYTNRPIIFRVHGIKMHGTCVKDDFPNGIDVRMQDKTIHHLDPHDYSWDVDREREKEKQ